MIYDSQQSTLTTLPATELTPQVHWEKYTLAIKNIYEKKKYKQMYIRNKHKKQCKYLNI